MTSFPRRAVVRLRITAVVALVVMTASLSLPSVPVQAQSTLYPGAVGLVANSGAEPVLLRETPSFDAAVLSTVPEGATADIVEGPVSGDDGTPWYGVSYGGLYGYIVAGYLADTGQAAAEGAPVELAQEAVVAEWTPEAAPEGWTAEAAPVETVAPEVVSEAAPAGTVATADVYLRSEPNFAAMAMMVIPAGSVVTPTGEWVDQFAGVMFQGQYGWVEGNWLGAATADTVLAPQATDTAAVDSGLIGDLTAAPAGGAAYAVDVVNLRAGPSEGDEVLRVLPAGGAVTVTGEAIYGWVPVWYNGTSGYISADLLSFDSAPVSLAQEAAPETAPVAAEETGGLTATTTSDVNLRSGPDINAPVIDALPPGVAMTALAGPEQGFYQVAYGDLTGWVSADYLQISLDYYQRGNRNRQQDGKVEGSEPVRNAELGAGGIIWPVTGGTWYIMQGYHGSSHQNGSSLWQYEYSLDLARADGNTAGQQVISPVNGVVTWTDPGTGGISIDIGNGHAVAMFHVTFLGSLQAGTPVSQGQYLGQISGPGGPGFAGTPHLHFTLWQTSDNGNWDRRAVPFTGAYAISGMDFPDAGGGNTYRGLEFRP